MANRAVRDPNAAASVITTKQEPIYIIHRQLIDPSADLPVDDQPLYGVGFFTEQEAAGTEANRLTAIEPYPSVNYVVMAVQPA